MDFKCDHCNKSFKSYQSRWNHVNRYHKNINIQELDINIHNNIHNDIQKCIYKCSYCKKEYNTYFIKWRHEKKCKHNKSGKTDEIKELKKENLQMKEQMEELKDMLQKALKIHPKTLQKINNQLNNSHNNNGIINNYYLQVGNEGLTELMSAKEKKNILNLSANCINELIRKVHVSSDENI